MPRGIVGRNGPQNRSDFHEIRPGAYYDYDLHGYLAACSNEGSETGLVAPIQPKS